MSKSEAEKHPHLPILILVQEFPTLQFHEASWWLNRANGNVDRASKKIAAYRSSSHTQETEMTRNDRESFDAYIQGTIRAPQPREEEEEEDWELV